MVGILQKIQKKNNTIASSDDSLMSRTMFVVNSKRYQDLIFWGAQLHNKTSFLSYEEQLREQGVRNVATLDLDVGAIIKSYQNETLTETFKKVPENHKKEERK